MKTPTTTVTSYQYYPKVKPERQTKKTRNTIGIDLQSKSVSIIYFPEKAKLIKKIYSIL